MQEAFIDNAGICFTQCLADAKLRSIAQHAMTTLTEGA
jgi:hypothetical protein